MGFNIPMTESVLTPAGEHEAIIRSVDKTAGRYGDQVRITFELANGDRIWMYCAAIFSERSKLGSIVAAIFGKFPAPGTAFQSAWLVNRRVRILVGHHARPDGTQSARVEAVLAPDQPITAPPPPPAPDNNDVPF